MTKEVVLELGTENSINLLLSIRENNYTKISKKKKKSKHPPLSAFSDVENFKYPILSFKLSHRN